MGGWYLTKKEDIISDENQPAHQRRNTAVEKFRLHGFEKFEFLDTDSHAFLFAYPPRSSHPLFARSGSDWIAAAGTLVYQGETGSTAMALLLDNFVVPFLRWNELKGQFSLIVYKSGNTYVLTDYTGSFQLFHDHDFKTLSTSLISICAEQESLNFDAQGVYEYVFNGFPLGNDTVFMEIQRLSPQVQLSVGKTTEQIPVKRKPIKPLSDEPREELVRQHADRLLNLFEQTVPLWKGNVRCPLSGGLDSRLALALLRRIGADPDVYVYGDENEVDVKIARLIGGRIGTKIQVVDKATWQELSHDAYSEQVLSNFLESDGLVTDDGLFNTAASSDARKMRQDGYSLVVSGGCGEVFRNFFYLPDRPRNTVDVIHAFFCRYDKKDLTNEFDESRFIGNMVDKANAVLETESSNLNRQQVEALYPFMRCRAFFGREISIEGRLGDYFMPFLDSSVVDEALRLPFKLKQAGSFEASVLTYLDPELASFVSAYGHSFSDGASVSHRFSEWATVARPMALRKASYSVRKSLNGRFGARSINLSRYQKVIDLELPFMSRFFKFGIFIDPISLRRVAALEYIGEYFKEKIRC